MTLKETLAALDERATKGEYVFTGRVSFEDAQFHAALVNLYRANKLVLVPSVEEMSEPVAKAIDEASKNARLGQDWKWFLPEANAAIAAILTSMGAKTA